MKREVALGTTTVLAAVFPIWVGISFMRWFGLSVTNGEVLLYLAPGAASAIAGVLLLAGASFRYVAGIIAWLLLAAVTFYDVGISWRSHQAGENSPIEILVAEVVYLVIAVPVLALLIKRVRSAPRKDDIAA